MDHRRIAALRAQSDATLPTGIYDIPLVNDTPSLDHPLTNHDMDRQLLTNHLQSSTNANQKKKMVLDSKNIRETQRKRLSGCCEIPESKFSDRDLSDLVRSNSNLNVSNEHHETLLRLRRQESDLQREMKLLDEMLQGCAAESQETRLQINDLEPNQSQIIQDTGSNSESPK